MRLNLLEDSKWPLLAKRRAFETVTREELVKFAKDLRQNCYVQMHIQGNFYQTEAVEIFNNSLKKLNGKTCEFELPGKQFSIIKFRILG